MNLFLVGWFIFGAMFLTILCAIIYLLYRRKSERKHQIIQREIDKKYEEEISKNLRIIEQTKREYDTLLQEKNTQLNKINESLLALNEERQRLIEENQKISASLSSDVHSLKVQKAVLSESLSSIKSSTETKILYGAKEHKSYLFEELQKDFDTKRLTLSQECAIIEKEKEKVQAQLQELQNSRAAAIAAFKREEEIKQQADFYKIQLQETDIEDIKLLRSIERYLVNKDALYKLIWATYYQKPYKDMVGRLLTGKVCGIYRITNLLDNRTYIGQSVDIGNRWSEHIKSSLGIGTIAHQKIHDAIATKGIENFTFEVIEECDKPELSAKEKLWIKTYQSDSYGYNATSGG